MAIKRFIKYYILGESIKEIELNRILDKINTSKKLTKREKDFLDLYHATNNIDEKDYMYLSKETAFKKIRVLLENEYKVICNLKDRDGLIGYQILNVENDIHRNTHTLFMKNDFKMIMPDNYLYNLMFITNKQYYSLECHDEYYEKLHIEK